MVFISMVEPRIIIQINILFFFSFLCYPICTNKYTHFYELKLFMLSHINFFPPNLIAFLRYTIVILFLKIGRPFFLGVYFFNNRDRLKKCKQVKKKKEKKKSSVHFYKLVRLLGNKPIFVVI